MGDIQAAMLLAIVILTGITLLFVYRIEYAVKTKETEE